MTRELNFSKLDKINAISANKTLQDYVGEEIVAVGLYTSDEATDTDNGYITYIVADDGTIYGSISPTISRCIDRVIDYMIEDDLKSVRIIATIGKSKSGRDFLNLTVR